MAIKVSASTEKDYLYIAKAITKFNFSNLPEGSNRYLSSLGFVIKEDKTLIGGVYGKLLLGNCLSIEVLWVEEQFRNHGYGSELIYAIESAAINLDSRLSIVDTFDFQALDFYLKLGYVVFGTLDDCPCIGNKRYYLKKILV